MWQLGRDPKQNYSIGSSGRNVYLGLSAPHLAHVGRMVRVARTFVSLKGGRHVDLLAPWGGEQNLGEYGSMLPFLFLAGEHRAAKLTPVGCRRGEPG